jgi:hypothetical protein
MNRRFQKKFDEHVAEKRGWHWALTRFMMEAIGDSESSKLND